MPPLSLGFGVGLCRGGAPRPRFEVNFAALGLGAITLPAGVAFTRASGSTVQTGTSSIVTGLGNDVALGGRWSDSWSPGLSIGPARTNQIATSHDYTEGTVWSDFGLGQCDRFVGQSDPTGGTGATRIQVVSGGVLSEKTAGATASAGCAVSLWVRSGAPNASLYRETSGRIAVATVPTTWQRILISATTIAETAALTAVDGRNQSGVGGLTAGARDVVIWGAMREHARYPDELIETTGTTATRAGGRLAFSSAAAFFDNGTLSLDVSFRTKLANTDLPSGAVRLFECATSAPGSVLVSWNAATGAFSIFADGDLYASSAFPFARYDSLRVFARVGVLPTVIRAQVNGGLWVTLSATASTRPAISPTGAAYVCSTSTSTAQWASWIDSVRSWPASVIPS